MQIKETVSPEIQEKYKQSIERGTLLSDLNKRIEQLEKVVGIQESVRKLTYIDPWTKGEISVDRMLSCSIGLLKTACLIGFDKSDSLYFASSTSDKKTNLWIAENFKNFLINKA